jgi:hypothetical protein
MQPFFEPQIRFKGCLGHLERPILDAIISLAGLPAEGRMSELAQIISGDGAAAPPAFILEGLTADQAHRRIPHAPHTIFEELWHITFWQQVSLDWVRGLETPFPAHAAVGFPSEAALNEGWDELRGRFFRGNDGAAGIAGDSARLDLLIRCPSRPGKPIRTMTVREQLENLAAHNHYHFGRIVLLRQLLGAWPPTSGGFSW